jgi:predicted phosphodiesterase
MAITKKIKFAFLGDVHADISWCKSVCENHPDSTVVQIGDLGVGFVANHLISKLPSNFRFFVGNHDCRKLSYEIPSCLGDYGEAFDKFFFVSGADSFDKEYRIEGVDWWPDEELTYAQAEDCLDKWKKSSLKVIVSHDIPQVFAEKYQLIYDKCITRNLLQAMITVRKPELVITGHHHKSKTVNHEGITWRSVDINEVFVIEL